MKPLQRRFPSQVLIHIIPSGHPMGGRLHFPRTELCIRLISPEDHPSPSAATATPLMVGPGIVTGSSSHRAASENSTVCLQPGVTRNRLGRWHRTKRISYGPSFFPTETTI